MFFRQQKTMSDKFSFFVAICPYEDLKVCFNLLPKCVKMYVKCEMEDPGLRKIALVWNKKVSVEHVMNLVPVLTNICGSKCDGKGRHILATKYIRWREWMKESHYEKLSNELRKRSKFLNRPWLPSKDTPTRVHNFFEERTFHK